MVDILSRGVMRGLVAANLSLNTADSAYGIYNYAKAKGDISTMERALGYANDFTNDATNAAKEAMKDLTENVEAKRKSDKESEAARIEEIREKINEEKSVNNDNNENNPENRTDTVEISPEAASVLHKEQNENIHSEKAEVL